MAHVPQHTAAAYRWMARPAASETAAAATDLMHEVLEGHWDPRGVDQDGTPLLALALNGWRESRQEAVPPAGALPLPGEQFDLPPSGPAWQWPAAALLWKGAQPFAGWPTSGLAWGPGQPAQCPVLVALKEGAWDVLDACLRHPDCPPAAAFDALTVHDGRPLLHALAQHPWAVRGLEALLRHGLDPNVPNDRGQSPLFVCEDPDAVRALLAAGANPHRPDAAGDTAPVHWGRRLKNPRPLIEAWQAHGNAQVSNGRMVVASLKANAWSAVETAIQASGWDPLSPVDPAQHPTRRLLEAASMALLEHVRGGQALPLRPLQELLSSPMFKNAWSLDEKATASAALSLVLNLATQERWTFSAHSQKAAAALGMALRREPGVVEREANAAAALLASTPLEESRHQTLWMGWLKGLPSRAHPDPPTSREDWEARGWGTVGVLATHPPAWFAAQLKNPKDPWDWGLLFQTAYCNDGFSWARADELEAFLRFRAMEGVSEEKGVLESDRAWQAAWEALPDHPPFPLDAPWFERFLRKNKASPDGRAAAHQWREWALQVNLPEVSTPTRSRPRL